MTRCFYHEFCVAFNVPELTKVVCQIDNVAFNSYLPDQILFSRGGPNNRIADGSKECVFIWETMS